MAVVARESLSSSLSRDVARAFEPVSSRSFPAPYCGAHGWGLKSPYVYSGPSIVAQSCTLLYRRFEIGWASKHSGALQNAILRYGRLQICATLYTYESPLSRQPGKPDPQKGHPPSHKK